MNLSNRVYNFLKFFTTVFLPAVGAFYFALSEIWGFPNSEGVNGTINAVIVFLGVLIGISSNRYNKTVNRVDGDLYVQEDDGEHHLSLGINNSISEIANKETVRLRVDKL